MIVEERLAKLYINSPQFAVDLRRFEEKLQELTKEIQALEAIAIALVRDENTPALKSD